MHYALTQHNKNMKTSTYTVKNRKGVTLIELTVVIAIILLLISILFIGAKFYRDGADKSACVVNINGIQKAARSVQNLRNLAVADAIAPADFSGTADDPLPVLPVCPTANTAYTLLGTLPALGTPVAECADSQFGGPVSDLAAEPDTHAPSDTNGW